MSGGRARSGLVTAALVATVVVASGCSTSRAREAATPAQTTSTSTTTTSTSTTAGLSAQDVTDVGLPSQVGPGPLPVGVVTQLMQYFEDGVAAAYAANDADRLYRYLAGNMLTGNRASINVLRAQGKRNLFSISVTSVDISDNEAQRITFDLKATETKNYFVDTTNSTLEAGLPGPADLSFLIFLDFNPQNRTWYWTGAQNTQSGGVPPAPAGP